MLLSVQQKYILVILRKLGCVHRRQLDTLVREKFRRPDLEISDARMDAMLRQLRAGSGDVRFDSNFVWLSDAQPDTLCLEAVDVMLELSEGKPEDIKTRLERPQILRFSWGEDFRVFTVAELSASIHLSVEALASKKRVIWISSNGSACQTGSVPEGLTLPPKHFFAARQSDGSHRFYGSNGP